MEKNRLEAFSDGVIAIIITIMVLELKAPEHNSIHALWPLWPRFIAYVISFAYVGIYWNNHHHLFHAAERISGMTLWANLHLLFWLSLIPFTTDWVGESRLAVWPVVMYGINLLLCASAWIVLDRALIRCHAADSPLVRAIGGGKKEWRSILYYAVAIPSAFISPWLAFIAYFIVAAMWFVPDRRIEHQIRND